MHCVVEGERLHRVRGGVAGRTSLGPPCRRDTTASRISMMDGRPANGEGRTSSVSWFQMTVVRPKTCLAMARTRASTSPYLDSASSVSCARVDARTLTEAATMPAQGRSCRR